MKKLFAAFLIAGLAVGCGNNNEESQKNRGIRIQIDPTGNEAQLMAEIGRRFTEKTGIEVEAVVGPASSSERLNLYRQMFGARSEDIDIYELDIIWPSILAPHLEDLAPLLADDRNEFIQESLTTNTVSGRLVAIPLFINTGILYYRPSILKKYGFHAPPETWQELQEMSEIITEGEQAAGNPDFWAYSWQGAAYEGLTCNVIEWIESEGGEYFDEQGIVRIDSEESNRGLSRALGWIGTISSPNVLHWKESESEKSLTSGNAAFFRSWPTARARLEEGPIGDDFAIAPLPKGSVRSSAVIGGWGLGISKYSPMKEEAGEFLKYITSEEVLRYRTLEGKLLPPRMAIYKDKEVQEALPWLQHYIEILPNVASRPAVYTEDRYGEISALLFTEVNRMLQGEQSVDETLKTVQSKASSFLE